MSDDVFGKVMSFLSMTELCGVSGVSSSGLIGNKAVSKNPIWRQLVQKEFQHFLEKKVKPPEIRWRAFYMETLRKCIISFNTKPSRWNTLFSDKASHSVLTQQKVRILLTACRMDIVGRASLGLFFGNRQSGGCDVLVEFLKSLDLSGLSLFWALRIVLTFIRLPGEACLIDRMMEVFAKVYLEINNTTYMDQDCIHILCFSIIMLSTDLHSPLIRSRMSFKQFLRSNRGINNGKDVPLMVLREIYDNVSIASIVSVPDGDISQCPGEASGWLKCGRMKLWCEVKNGVFRKYSSNEDEKSRDPMSTIKLSYESCCLNISIPIAERGTGWWLARGDFNENCDFTLTHYGERMHIRSRTLSLQREWLAAIAWNMLPGRVRERFEPYFMKSVFDVDPI